MRPYDRYHSIAGGISRAKILHVQATPADRPSLATAVSTPSLMWLIERPALAPPSSQGIDAAGQWSDPTICKLSPTDLLCATASRTPGFLPGQPR